MHAFQRWLDGESVGLSIAQLGGSILTKLLIVSSSTFSQQDGGNAASSYLRLSEALHLVQIFKQKLLKDLLDNLDHRESR